MRQLCMVTYQVLLCIQLANTWNSRSPQDYDSNSMDSSEEWPMRYPPPSYPPSSHRRKTRRPEQQTAESRDFIFPATNGDFTFPTTTPEIRRRGQGQNQNRGQNNVNNNSNNNNNINTGRRNQRVCERKYAEYVERIFPNEAATIEDAKDTDFDGRELAAPGEYPHMAALGFETKNSQVIDYKCGGSLISESFVITAAHCTNITGETPSKVRIGDLNLKVMESYLEPQTRRIKRIYNHPNYNSNSYYHDIALLELETELTFTEFVRPIRLWVRIIFPYSMAFAMGYGSTAFAKERTNRLTHLNMTIVPNDECNRRMPEMPEAEVGIIDSQICALDYKYNRDTCQGDSGGPLQLNLYGKRRRRKHYHLIGITSYGLICRSGHPSVYTRVSSYIDWIESIVWPLERQMY